MSFPNEHGRQLHATNPRKRRMREVGCRADVVAIFPNRAAVRRLIGMILMEQHDEWLAAPRRFFTLIDAETPPAASRGGDVAPKPAVWYPPYLAARTRFSTYGGGGQGGGGGGRPAAVSLAWEGSARRDHRSAAG